MLVRKDPWGASAYCGGVWINEDHIVTAKHCVGGDKALGNDITFQTYEEFDGKYPYNKNDKTYVAIVVAVGEDVDVAVLKSKKKHIRHNVVKIFKGDIVIGGKVHVVGHPKGLPYNYTTGTISQIRDMDVNPDGDVERYYVLHITTSATYGSSGSGVYDINGNLLGIACFLIRDMPGALFYLHRDLVVEVLDQNSITYY
jgi:S1-C subfamily serine protease